MFERTLHEAMRIVLSERRGHAAATVEISEAIEKQHLYTRQDGRSPKANQINARARRYPDWFDFIEPGVIRLKPSAGDLKTK